MDASIKNYIFDLGNVLVRFDPMGMTRPYVQDPVLAEEVCQVVFDRLYWDPLDDGSITDEALKAACHARLPQELHDVADMVYDHWPEHLPMIDGMQDLVLDIKKAGGKLYLLSNVSIGFAEQYPQVPMFRELFSHFDGLVFSGPLGIVKPSAEIFNYVLSRFALNAAESIFIDDNAANIAGAKAVGIQAYHFDGDADKLRNALGVERHE